MASRCQNPTKMKTPGSDEPFPESSPEEIQTPHGPHFQWVPTFSTNTWEIIEKKFREKEKEKKISYIFLRSTNKRRGLKK